MSPWVIGFLVGLFVGTPLGYFIAALMVIASEDRRDRNRPF